tara:strand:- start:1884 stop:2258 length:375 start_codon:yes stop_codon:yes gene_type:complete
MPANPAIYVTRTDYDRLSGLVAHNANNDFGAALLGEELDRAILVRLESSRSFVRLNSAVTYLDMRTGRQRQVTVVLPEHADIDQRMISVLSPVGAALMGLVPGRVFSWEDERGRACQIRIMSID